MFGVFARGLAICLALVATPALAAKPNIADEFTELRQRDQMLQSVAWRLLTGNVDQCEKTRPLTGLLLQDAGAYRKSSAIRDLLGVEGDFFIQSVVPGSPAFDAGLEVGMEVLSIDGKPLHEFPLAADAPWLRLSIIQQRLEFSLADSEGFQLSVAGKDDPVVISGTHGCDARFEMITGNKKARADGRRVLIGSNFPGLAYPEDEFAAVLAHELAHNLLKHPDWLKRVGRKRKHVRPTEREADRMMPWLLANAGYDPAAAVRFMQRWGPKHGGGLFRKRTHDGWDERVEFIKAELPLVARSVEADGTATWRANFRREVGAD